MARNYEIRNILSSIGKLDDKGVHHLYLFRGVMEHKRRKETDFEKLLFAVSCIDEDNAAELLEVANAILKRQQRENMKKIRAESKKGGEKE